VNGKIQLNVMMKLIRNVNKLKLEKIALEINVVRAQQKMEKKKNYIAGLIPLKNVKQKQYQNVKQ